jgi:hypothetical protein
MGVVNMKSMGKDELKELLIKCWMSHDAMWFYHCVQNLGIEKANELNLASIRSLSEIEVPRMTKALGLKKERIQSFKDIKEVIDGLFSIVKGNFMQSKFSFPSENCMHWEMQRCFAYEGVKRMGMIDQYRCGIIYRVKCWIDVLGLNHSITIPVDFCMMHSIGRCSGDFKFYFDK